jgi:hypothetical protein
LKTLLRHCLCHLKLNAVPYFAIVKDSQIDLAVERQSRQISLSTSPPDELPLLFLLAVRSESYGLF